MPRPERTESSIPLTSTYARLFHEHRRQMVTLARMLTGSLEIAEDLVQEAFVKLQNVPSPRAHQSRTYAPSSLISPVDIFDDYVSSVPSIQNSAL